MYYINEYEYVTLEFFEGQPCELLKVDKLNEKVTKFPVNDLRKIYKTLTSKHERIAVWRMLKEYDTVYSGEYQKSVHNSILSQIA